MTVTSARLIALDILNGYKPKNTNLSELLGLALKKTPSVDDPGFVRELVWGTVRYLKPIDGLISDCATKKTLDPEIRNILRLGLFQLVYLKNIVPEYAALNESVELARKIGRPQAAGFVNAVLRKAQKAQAGILPAEGKVATVEEMALKFSYPTWMVKRWFARFGEKETADLCAWGDRPGNLTIRANTAKISRDDLKNTLGEEGAVTEDCKYSPAGLRFKSNPRLEALKSYKKGLFFVQDEASQLIPYLLGSEPEAAVLDLCCGAGIKFCGIGLLAQNRARITAVDSSAPQLQKAGENIKAYGLKNITLIKADVLKLKNIRAKYVLLDAPCSGLGSVSRKPDIKWNRTENDITERYPKLQKELLSAAAGYVEPGGTLVYSTCTTEPEENAGVVEAFLGANAGFALEKPGLPLLTEQLLSSDGRFFETFTHRQGTDSFFGAKMKRMK